VVPLGLCALVQTMWGLQAHHIWTAIVLGHMTRCALSIAIFRREKWKAIRVELAS
jgi:Na+-driven multidrug efflux pump